MKRFIRYYNRKVESPKGSIEDSLQMLVTTLDSSEYVGKIAIGKITRGIAKKTNKLLL